MVVFAGAIRIMSKAIVVIDLPNYLDEQDIPELLCDVKVIQYDEYIFSKHSLKLKPMPEKVKIDPFVGRDPRIEDYSLDDIYDSGWNACIDRILEGEEE